MNIIKLSIKNTFIKNELPSGRTLMATLGDDGDIRYIYVYYDFISKKSKFFYFFCEYSSSSISFRKSTMVF